MDSNFEENNPLDEEIDLEKLLQEIEDYNEDGIAGLVNRLDAQIEQLILLRNELEGYVSGTGD